MGGNHSQSRPSGKETNLLLLLAIESIFFGTSASGKFTTPKSDNVVPSSWKGQQYFSF
jgi:hypothetical protein